MADMSCFYEHSDSPSVYVLALHSNGVRSEQGLLLSLNPRPASLS